MKDDNFLRENNARHMWHPMGHQGQQQANPPAIITGATGVRITDIDGREMVDAVGGLWNVNLGYSCDPVKDAISNQLQELPYYSSFAGTSNDAAIELSWMLREFFAPEGMGRAFFTSGGSDSVETALRLARQYHKIKGEQTRTKFLSLKKGYHGTHFGGASVNGNNKFRTAYEPLLPGCRHLPAPYTYRNPFNETDPAKLSQLILQAAEDEIMFEGPNTIAAFIMEPVLGAGGIMVPHETFMPGMQQLCSKHGILMIADEVITGFGRTGDWSGSRHWGVQPDFMCTAKAITNGYYPFGACMIAEHVAEVFERAGADGFVGHGYTYTAHPVGAAAAIACLKETERLDVKTNAAARGTQMFEGAKRLMEKHSAIGDVRGGHGLMTGIEFVKDRATKAPMDPSFGLSVQKVAMDNGVMLRASGPNILLSPPLIISEVDVGVILNAIDAGLTATSY
ncbi:MAG: aminotransferase class III-fold pyridoxal phosphate-dependent enzyme [Amylibacter sp.]|nr:aminotransferase class III-fold pyridoxal phosphate-dependent enzyme [Amylibacter sp.]MDG1236722.1 aminotransferase class III-fold pyridoxal phosphate-dependent enzyme [Amylibacter sp.]MDG1999415.1 aminotransferase class III-fold pyridoxal phosphate-dependent enzyme [Amylibacter sp.]|tara:strand:- start:4361 stop:5716 length:1356 start_codon:yes stop_codon:yes gene_type:complete